MKRILFITILLFAAVTAFAQSSPPPVPFGDFTKWAKQAQIPGYTLIEIEKDGSDFVASFASVSATLLQIRVSDIKYYKTNTSGIQKPVAYNWNGYPALFSSSSQMTFFVVSVPETKLCFVFGCNGTLTKTAMEGLVSKANIKSLTSSGVVSDVTWPEGIPAELKVPCVKAIFTLGPDGTYKQVYEVKAFMNAELVEGVEAILRKFKAGNSLTGITSGQVTFICSVAEDLPQMRADFLEGEVVTFMYYVK
jgi:ubiquitin